MNRYIVTVVFAVIVIGLYHFINLRLFSLDLTRQVKNALFDLRTVPKTDPTIVVLTVGKLQPAEIQVKIDSLLLTEPRKIGVNLCHFERIPKGLINRYQSDDRVVFANCDDLKTGSLSLIINDEGAVTHFRTDKPDYFELKLTDFKGRGNSMERINYGSSMDYKGELKDSYYWINSTYLKDKTLLLGYMGEYLTDSIYYYNNCRVTPLNRYYGSSNIPPDFYEIEISANIIRTINDDNFINEVNPVLRILVILAFSLLNVIILTFAKTRWVIVNLIIATMLFILLTGFGSLLMVIVFDKRNYLEMDELPLILIIATVFTVMLNIKERRAIG